jgi:flagellar assembly protein FliH
MSTSPDPADPIVRGSRARSATAARFQVDFRRSTEVPVPPEVMEKARASAVAAGYAEGWAQGQREAKAAAQLAEAQARTAEEERAQARAAVLERALEAVLAAADQLAQRSVPVLAELEDAVLHTAVELAEALVGRALADSAESGLDALRRVLALAPETGTLTVRLNPDDLASLEAPDGDYVVAGRVVRLYPDPSLSPGDAIAGQGTTTIDARMAQAIRRVREELAR